jgi:hypothetical protein
VGYLVDAQVFGAVEAGGGHGGGIRGHSSSLTGGTVMVQDRIDCL